MNSALRKIYTFAGVLAAVSLMAACETVPEKKPEPAPAPKPAPAPAPKPVEAPKPAPKPKPEFLNSEEKIELQGMPFAKAEMTADNKKELDEFLGDLRKATKARSAVRFGAVVVTGHTDRIGSQQANQKLSEQRAEAAKTVLVRDVGVPADKIETLGMGKTLPIKSCPDAEYKTQAALVECLAPNRRVVINIRGVGK